MYCVTPLFISKQYSMAMKQIYCAVKFPHLKIIEWSVSHLISHNYYITLDQLNSQVPLPTNYYFLVMLGIIYSPKNNEQNCSDTPFSYSLAANVIGL